MKILPVGADLFHADGQTDTTKRTVALRNFANVTEMKSATKYGVNVRALACCSHYWAGYGQGDWKYWQ